MWSVPTPQLKTYHSDFESERKSREQMAGTVDQLKSELHKKEMEVKRLHSHLNRSAANQMKAEMEVRLEISEHIWCCCELPINNNSF